MGGVGSADRFKYNSAEKLKLGASHENSPSETIGELHKQSQTPRDVSCDGPFSLGDADWMRIGLKSADVSDEESANNVWLNFLSDDTG